MKRQVRPDRRTVDPREHHGEHERRLDWRPYGGAEILHQACLLYRLHLVGFVHQYPDQQSGDYDSDPRDPHGAFIADQTCKKAAKGRPHDQTGVRRSLGCRDRPGRVFLRSVGGDESIGTWDETGERAIQEPEHGKLPRGVAQAHAEVDACQAQARTDDHRLAAVGISQFAPERLRQHARERLRGEDDPNPVRQHARFHAHPFQEKGKERHYLVPADRGKEDREGQHVGIATIVRHFRRGTPTYPV